MIKVKSTFKERWAEIKIYINFVKLIETDKVAVADVTPRIRVKEFSGKKFLSLAGDRKPKLVDIEIKKILKANIYLLLYNLVESTVRNAVEGIYEHLKNNSVTFHDVRDELKLEFMRNLKQHVNNNDINKFTRDISDITTDIVYLTFNPENKFNGNVDARFIREKVEKMGFTVIANARLTRDGADLLSIKSQRNSLTHGNISFADCGKDLTIQELEDMCERTRKYLEAFIKCTEKYLVDCKYKKMA